MASLITVAGVENSPEFVQLSSTAVALGTLCDDLTVAVSAVAGREELAAYAAKHDAGFKLQGNAVAVLGTERVVSAADAIAYMKATYVGRSPFKLARATHSNDADGGAAAGTGAGAGAGAAVGAGAGAEETKYDYDLVVIGGGSAGMAGAKQAAELGAKVMLLDYVKPSPAGTKWGLGGTCVNVGCIPKKLFHTAALYGEVRSASANYGWEGAGNHHDWDALKSTVNQYIRSLNFEYRAEMVEAGVKYKNALGSFVDAHTLKLVDKRKRESTVTTRRVLIAVGGRPTPLPCEGGNLAIDSDDIFTLDHDPGKTLVIGASYVALECAGFLTGTGHDTTVMVRSIFLRGFDQAIANMIAANMEAHGTKFIKPATPSKIERQEDGKLKVTWTQDGAEHSDVFDTVLAAVGRRADTAGLNLDAVGVTVESNGKIPCVNEQTNVSHVYACGDVLYGHLELTPVAIQAAKLLMNRLYGGSTKAMDYDLVPTTVFTPMEYGTIGLAEEDAIAKLGEDNVEVYHNKFSPLEWAIAGGKKTEKGYLKLVCDLRNDCRVVGLHYLGPNAGEVTQGFATAMRLGAKFSDFYDTVGIHPTTAEKFTTLTATKRNGKSIESDSC